MPDIAEIEITVKERVKKVFVDYARGIGRDVSDVTEETKLKFPSGLKLTNVELVALRVPLNEILSDYQAPRFVDSHVTAFNTIKTVQDAAWARIKPTVEE